MKKEFFEKLRTMLDQAFSEEWDPKRPIRFEIVDEESESVLRFFVKRRDASWDVAHEEPVVGIAHMQDVDDLVARALSTLLMKHPGWPR